MATRKKSKKVKKSSASKKPTRRKARSESGNSSSSAALVSTSTTFVQEPSRDEPLASAPTPRAPVQRAPVQRAPVQRAPTPSAPFPSAPAFEPSVAAESAPVESPRSSHLAPALPAPGPSSARIVKHSPPSAGQVQPSEPPPAPKPARRASKAKPTPSPRLPLPDKLTQAQIYETLAALLVPYARHMESEMHPKLGFCLKAKSARTGREAHFGGVQALPDGVAFHLFPLYSYPELLETVSPELFNRMRSKTHFHFEELNAGILDELMQLTREGFERFLADGMA
ncbi:MAG: hypothetical protein EXS08_07030 [Planctomycetes bacterium]|nr:hypothetical protein [Planctomycetota bacterium]